MDADRDWVRELARRVAEIARSPANERIRKRWRDVNALRRPDRAPVWCRPVGAWEEILPASSMRCRDERLRGWERVFRQILHKHEIGDDTPVQPFIGVSPSFRIIPPNVWGFDLRHVKSREPGGSWAYDPALKTAADYERLQMPRAEYDEAATRRSVGWTEDLFGDILPVRLQCLPQFSATLGTAAADLRGLEQMMVDMIESPHLMHRLMGHLRDGTLALMDDVARTGLLTPNTDEAMTCSDPIGAPDAAGRYGYENCWAMANSQEFDQVSPAMWEEFCLNYQKPILARYGLVGYGCCENLTHKIEGVLSIPNLRIFVCSAWTDAGRVIERVGRKHVIMWRQKASDVVFAEDESTLRRALDEGMRAFQGCFVQVVLRELQTLNGHPDRLHVWTRLAIEAAEKYA